MTHAGSNSRQQCEEKQDDTCWHNSRRHMLVATADVRGGGRHAGQCKKVCCIAAWRVQQHGVCSRLATPEMCSKCAGERKTTTVLSAGLLAGSVGLPHEGYCGRLSQGPRHTRQCTTTTGAYLLILLHPTYMRPSSNRVRSPSEITAPVTSHTRPRCAFGLFSSTTCTQENITNSFIPYMCSRQVQRQSSFVPLYIALQCEH